MRIVASADISGAVARLRAIGTEVKDKAVVRAVNKVAAQAKVQSAREIRDAGYNLKIGEIKKSIDISRANPGLVVASVRAKGRPIGLIKYGAKSVKGGVRVNVKTGPKTIQGAFIQTMRNGHTGVFVLKDHAKTWRRESRGKFVRNPIEELFGPSIPQAFVNQIVRSNLVAFVRDKFPQVLQQEVNFLNLKR